MPRYRFLFLRLAPGLSVASARGGVTRTPPNTGEKKIGLSGSAAIAGSEGRRSSAQS